MSNHEIIPTGVIPSFDFSNFGLVILLFLVLITVGVVTTVFVYLYIRKKRFNINVVVFEKEGGSWKPTRRDKAMNMSLGQGGDRVLYLQRHKKYLPFPKEQVTAKTFWYKIDETGEWYSCVPEDVNKQPGVLGLRSLDEDVRLARTSIQKILKERYNEPGFWQKYAGIVMYTTLILITGIMVFLLFDQYTDLARQVSNSITAAASVTEKAAELLVAVDNLN